MSLAIDIDKVTKVLIDGVWYVVKFEGGRSTFDLDAYEFLQGKTALLLGGVEKLVPATGFTFKTEDSEECICGPLTSIQALKYKQK